MAHIFVGHGGLDPADSAAYNKGMGVVAIPPGTTLQFYTDAGQTVRIGDIASAFAQLQAPWPPLTSENVTYNFSLTPESEDVINQWTSAIAGSGHELHAPGQGGLPDPIVLCDGTTETCPTDPRQNSAHGCTGLLGRFTGDLHWIACTAFAAPADDEMVNKAGDVPPTVFLNNDPDSWEQHTNRLVTELKEILQLHKDLGDLPGFVTYFKSDSFRDDERERVMDADEEIRLAVKGD
jgi:hypothetical protein